MNKQNPPINQPYPITCTIENAAEIGGLVGAINARIEYTGPGGLSGYWSATIQGDDEIYVLTAADAISRPGKWTFRPYVEKGGRVYRGDPYIEKFVA